jgi:diadenosine tetraphosphate (Ap4A) HIT family hydrolase
MADCSVCADIDRAERGEHPWAVARLPTDERAAHLLEMSEVAAAVHHGFGADKMNDEALGNRSAHLHWWLTPRRRTDRRSALRQRPVEIERSFVR